MFNEGEVDGAYSHIAAHPAISVWAGINSRSGHVEIHSDDGHRVRQSSFHKDSKPTWLSWHPSKRFLAVCWENGLVGVWSETEENLREGVSHRSPITCLEWSPGGSRLISCDEEGEVIVWKVDARGKISSICQYRLKGSIDRCIFRKSAAGKVENKQNTECSSFFLASSTGKIFYADDMGRCSDSGITSSKIMSMKLFEKKDVIALITEDMVLSQYSLSPEGKMNLENEIKISANGYNDSLTLQICWIEDGVIAIASGMQNIRLLDVINEENSVLTYDGLTREEGGFTTLSYCTTRNILAAGTDGGTIIFWKHFKPGQVGKDTSKKWMVWTTVSAPGASEKLCWGSLGTSLIAKKKSVVKIYTEQKMCCASFKGTSIFQLSPTVLKLQRDGWTPLEIEMYDRALHVAISSTLFAVSNGNSVQIYEYADDLSSAKIQSSINSNSLTVCIDHQNVIIPYEQKIDIVSVSGTIRNSIQNGQNDGSITAVAAMNNCLAMVTSKCFLKIYDISRREPRFVTAKTTQTPPIKSILEVAVNSAGNLIAYIATTDTEDINNILMVYSTEKDSFYSYDFKSRNCYPTVIKWDSSDPRLIVCETTNFEISSFFVSTDHGILLHDRYPKKADSDNLIGVSMPFHIFTMTGAIPPSIYQRVPIDFAGLEEADNSITAAMIEFCFQVDIGNLDNAFKSLSKVDNDRVWRNLARICVKKMRVDVATICLCNIKHAKAISALRRIEGENSTELKTAILAIYLDMHDEVQEIYKQLGRYDLLNLYYQESGQWPKALEIASTNDRINLRTTYVNFGRYLIEIGDRSGALAAFEQANCLSCEVPQNIFLNENDMKIYAHESRDKGIKRWWAQYEESRGNLVEASKFYEKSDDVLSIVRLNCVSGKIPKAIELSKTSGNPSAAYYIARQYERDNKISEAIEFYGQAKCFTQAIRLAKEHNLVNPLINFALQGSNELILDVARYLENSGQNLDKAISLYNRAGHFSKAIEMCFQAKEYHTLDDIASSLGPGVDIMLLQRCVNFFIENEQYEKAVHILTNTDRCREALSLCVAKNIPLNEELADKLGGSLEEGKMDANLLIQVGELCYNQKMYHLACKKFSQGGERIRAMKALLKSGDTERIIFFANVSGPKQKEIYVVAANYLQTLDWRNNQNIMKAIINFYTKARSYESLAGFYEACCQVEIDEYQNYEKALAALREAAKCLSKSKDTLNIQDKVKNLLTRIGFIEAFVSAKTMAKSNMNEMLKVCDQLLDEEDIENSVRTGDIFALMIETQYAVGNIAKARDILRLMQTRVSAMNLDYYLDSNILRSLRDGQPSGSHPSIDAPDEDIVQGDDDDE